MHEGGRWVVGEVEKMTEEEQQGLALPCQPLSALLSATICTALFTLDLAPGLALALILTPPCRPHTKHHLTPYYLSTFPTSPLPSSSSSPSSPQQQLSSRAVQAGAR